MKIPKAKKLPSGTWFIQLRLGGESIPVAARTEPECKKQAALIKAEYQAGVRDVSGKRGNTTLRSAIDAYITARDNVLSPETVRGYHVIKRNRFKAYMDMPAKRVDWQKACNLEIKTCSPKTLKNAWMFVVSVLREVGIEPQKVQLPQVVQSERPYLDPDQIKAFVSAIKDTDCEIPALLALHSLRRSEMCALTWDKVDLKNKRIRVSGSMVYDKDGNRILKPTNKSSTSQRYVPIMIPELLEAMAAQEDKTGSVILCAPDTIRKRINKVCESNGLPLVGIHGLRHSFASLAYHLRVPERITMQIGGWADLGTVHKIYTHLGQKDIAKYETEISLFFADC